MAWWLGFQAFTAVAWIQSLVGELRFHKPCGVAKKKDSSLSGPWLVPIIPLLHFSTSPKCFYILSGMTAPFSSLASHEQTWILLILMIKSFVLQVL